MTRLLPVVALMAALFLPPGPTTADARFARLSQTGIVGIVRHAHAPGTGDPAKFSLDDCATQRNLDARGRAQAREIGAATRADRQTAELRQFLFGLPPGETVVLITHYVNIRALTDRGVSSGQVLLLNVGRDGSISVVDEVLIRP